MHQAAAAQKRGLCNFGTKGLCSIITTPQVFNRWEWGGSLGGMEDSLAGVVKWDTD